jgi:uncharacterized MAPEG superfamily protein
MMFRGEELGVVKLRGRINEKKARKWMWAGLLALAALQMYFVQELLAALILFAVAFFIIAIVTLGLYLVDIAGQRGFSWVGQHSRPAFQLARRVWTLLEDVSRKQLHRPRSAPAR